MAYLRLPGRPEGLRYVLTALACCALAMAQGTDPSTLLKPSVDSWPTYHGDYTGQRHSRLTQITPDNVHQLTLAWAFQTGQAQQYQVRRRSS